MKHGPKLDQEKYGSRQKYTMYMVEILPRII